MADSTKPGENATDYLSASQMSQLVIGLSAIDTLIRIMALVTHVTYFSFIILVKDMRAISLIYMHQVNFFGLIFVLHFASYIGTSKPMFEDAQLDSVLCVLSETLWSGLKYFRSYSVLLLAIFRMVAVVNSNLFRKWVNSSRIILTSLVAQVLVCFSLMAVTKFAMTTTYGPFLCDDGFTRDFVAGIIYFAITSLLGMAIPCFFVMVVFVFTFFAIKNMSKRLNTTNRFTFITPTLIFHHSSTTDRTSMSIQEMNKKLSQKKRLTHQFFFINVCLLVSLLTFMFLNLINLLAEFESKWLHYRLVIRITCVLSQGIVPLVSLSGNPVVKAAFQTIWSKWKQTRFFY